MGLYAVAASQLVFWLIHTFDQTNLDAFFDILNACPVSRSPIYLRQFQIDNSQSLRIAFVNRKAGVLLSGSVVRE